MALQFLMAGMAAALRGVGNFKPGMIVQTATIVINIVLAPVLMFGLLGAPVRAPARGHGALVAVAVGTVWRPPTSSAAKATSASTRPI
jgi:Na+-driven multidrug efflux pump